MKRGIRELGTWNDALRTNNQILSKKKVKLEHQLAMVQQESIVFFARAQETAFLQANRGTI